MAFNGASIGGVVFPPLLILLIAKTGVEAAAVAVGIAMPLVIIPLSIFYLRRDPKGLGLAPDGLLIDSKPHVATPLTRSPRKDLIKTKGFMTLSVAFALALFAQVGLLNPNILIARRERGCRRSQYGDDICCFGPHSARLDDRRP